MKISSFTPETLVFYHGGRELSKDKQAKRLTVCLTGVMILLNNETEDRGRIFHEYDDGCIRDIRNHQKGEDAERIRSLRPCSWAWREECHDCHRRMESYRIYDRMYFGTAHLAVSFIFKTH